MSALGGAVHWEPLVAAAFRVQSSSYSPYSGYRVGAALLADDGRVFVGTNVENASYGLSLCAERSAIAAAVAAGARRFAAIAIVSPGQTPASPCGMCRQVLAEFAPPFAVRCVSESGTTFDTSTSELLPFAFDTAVLEAGRDSLSSSTSTTDARPSLRTLVDDEEDPPRATKIMGSTDQPAPSGRPPRLSTDRPPLSSLSATHPTGEAFVVGVALKAAAGTGDDLAKQQQREEAEQAARGTKKNEGQ